MLDSLSPSATMVLRASGSVTTPEPPPPMTYEGRITTG